MPCVWVQAWERSQHMPNYGRDIYHIVPPLNRTLQDTSAWINDATGVGQAPPKGWVIWLETK